MGLKEEEENEREEKTRINSFLICDGEGGRVNIHMKLESCNNKNPKTPPSTKGTAVAASQAGINTKMCRNGLYETETVLVDIHSEGKPLWSSG